ncbi:hypothetical protein Tco_0653524 [Tanacetum coccineum]|uniref:Uncharacterized protein n=1 Tax=Tanacetum coccineum TaxID=301880 RepID=A0ABQ4X0T5_9ASTR
MFVELINERKKHFARLREEAQRNKPPTKAQQRKTMCIYLKNMAGYKDKNLKNKSFDVIKKMFDKAYKQVNTFIPMDSEGSGKKDDNSGKKEENIQDEDIAINYEALAIKSPIIERESQILGANLNAHLPEEYGWIKGQEFEE